MARRWFVVLKDPGGVTAFGGTVLAKCNDEKTANLQAAVWRKVLPNRRIVVGWKEEG
jgi:hypothetical protein